MDYQLISEYADIVKEEGVLLCDYEDSYWLGIFDGDKLVGFGGIFFKDDEARFKSDWINPDYRGSSAYHELWAEKYNICDKRKIKVITAYVNDTALIMFGRKKFKVIFKDIFSGYTIVKKEYKCN